MNASTAIGRAHNASVWTSLTADNYNRQADSNLCIHGHRTTSTLCETVTATQWTTSQNGLPPQRLCFIVVVSVQTKQNSAPVLTYGWKNSALQSINSKTCFLHRCQHCTLRCYRICCQWDKEATCAMVKVQSITGFWVGVLGGNGDGNGTGKSSAFGLRYRRKWYSRWWLYTSENKDYLQARVEGSLPLRCEESGVFSFSSDPILCNLRLQAYIFSDSISHYRIVITINRDRVSTAPCISTVALRHCVPQSKLKVSPLQCWERVNVTND